MAGFLGTISGQVTLDIRPAVAAYATLRAQNARTVYALRGTGDAFVAAGKRMTVAGAGLLYVFGKAVGAAAEFERKMDFFGAITDTNSEKMKELSAFTLQLGQDTIYSADQVAEGFIELGKAGVTAEGIIQGLGVAMTNLGAATDIPLAESGQIILSTLQQFEKGAESAVAVSDKLAGAANASFADITDLGVSLKYVGGVAHTTGASLSDTIDAISLLAKAGIRGSTAGTSLRQMLVSLYGATGPATAALEDLGIITEKGTNRFYDQQGALKPLGTVFQILGDSLKGYNKQQRLAYLRTIFNNRALSAASILAREGAKGFKQMNNEIAKTDTAEVARKRLDNLSGDIEILRGNIETLMIRAGTPFQETIRGWVQSFTKLIQAFGKLDPETQKFIVQTIGVTGATLAVMGIFNIIIGTVFRFAAAMLKLGAGVKFLGKILKVVLVNGKFFLRLFIAPLLAGLAALSAPVLIAIAVILALAAAFIIAYKKSQKFREFVQNIGDWLVDAGKAIGNFFKLLATDPGAAWEKTKQGVSDLVVWIGDQFAKLPGLIADGLNAGVGLVQDWLDQQVEIISRLPGAIADALSGLGEQLQAVFTKQNINTAVQLMVDAAVQVFIKFKLQMISLALQTVEGLVKAMQPTPHRIGFIIGFMVALCLRYLVNLLVNAPKLMRQVVTGMVQALAPLAARVSVQMLRANISVSQGILRMIATAASMGPRVGIALIVALVTLPSRVFRLFLQVAAAPEKALPRMASAAQEFGLAALNGVSGALDGLPSLVFGVLGRAISAFNSMVSAAFSAARNFAGGLWEGFKSGLGISSPSFIERAAVQMTKTVAEETQRLKKQTRDIQRLGRGLAATQLGGGMNASVATMSATRRVGNRASDGQVTKFNGREMNKLQQAAQANKMKLIEGKLELRDGRAYISGIAQDVYDDNDQFDSVTRGQRR